VPPGIIKITSKIRSHNPKIKRIKVQTKIILSKVKTCQFILYLTNVVKIIQVKFLESFGETIKKLREEKDLPLRKVAAYLDIDQAILSKFEHGTRMPRREQVIQMAKYFNIAEKELLVIWLAGKVVYEIESDEHALEAMKVAEAQLIYRTQPKQKNK